MNFIRKLESLDLEELENNGVLILNEFIKKDKLIKIKSEIKLWLNNISFNNNLSTAIIGKNQWISHLGLCSKTSLEIALDDNLINFLEKYFKSDIILGECSYQKKILPETQGLGWHSDREDGIYVFVFMNKINIETGATAFIKKTHKIKKFEQNEYRVGDGATFINPSDIKNYIDNYIETSGGPGTIAIFSQNIWHKLPAFKKPGREMLWFKYFNSKKRIYAVDHLYRQSLLANLNDKQRKIFCIDENKNLKKGLTQIGKNSFEAGEHKISNFRMFLYFIRYVVASFFKK